MQNFVHLRLHTEYSLSDGLLVIPALMAKAAQNRMPAIGISDLGNLYGTVKFYQAAFGAGIKPLIGIDLRIIDEKESTWSLLTLFCQNHSGYLNLLKLVSKSFLEGQIEGKPTIKKTWLNDFSQGLIALSGGQLGDIGKAILSNDKKRAKKCLQFWRDTFPNRFYLEVNRIGKPKEEEYIEAIAQLAEKTKTPLVATNDVRFLEREDFEAHEARVCIQEGITLNDSNRPRVYTEYQYLRTPTEMWQLFQDMPQALENTVEIAKRCNLSFNLGQNRLPHFAVPAEYNTESYLVHLAKNGLTDRLNNTLNLCDDLELQKPYHQRLMRELNVINKMGFAGYFLIVADFTKWAKENNIPVGPGRGSGPGSLVAYALKITDLDPIALELLFERFLNPERISMPDFDIDFCMEGRDRVIEYVMQKHGYESVSHITTYGTMAAKAVVRDVGRVLALGYGFVDKIAKLIPFELGITLDKALTQEPLLKERYENEEEVKTLIDLARKLEGVVRNVGKHAGGIVIAPGKLIDFVPLYCEPNDVTHPVTQFDKDDVEAVGLVKFDFLGLRTLTIINRALSNINHTPAIKKDVDVDINHIPLNDVETFSLLKECRTIAVFQLESFGMRDLIKRLRPDCFEDLIALVALFRPGPLQAGMVDDFINRKHGRSKVLYPHPELAPILSPTYGVIVYQEQVMKIAQVLAGYTLGAADILRKAMGKKKPEEMAKQRKIFCDGAVKHGVNQEIAHHIFDLMEKFAGYGFNKSHSASYALIAYQTAWLKTHHPAAFMAAVLSSEMDRTEKIIMLLDECKALQLKVAPPDVNQCDYFFKVLDHAHLLYGLGAIKGVGAAAIENIVQIRSAGGPFTSLFNFCQRIDLRKLNRRTFEALIKCGSFDCFGKSRAVLLATLPIALQQAEQKLINQKFGQHDLLSFSEEVTSEPDYIEADNWPEDMLLAYEKDTLGFYLSGHPIQQHLKEVTHFTSGSIGKLSENVNQSARLVGIIMNIRTRQTKRNERIAIFTLDDGTAQLETVCFAEVYQKCRSLITEGQLVVVEGEISLDDFNNSKRFTARELYTLDQARERFAKSLQIELPEPLWHKAGELSSLFQPFLGGKCPIVLRYTRDNVQTDIKLSAQWNIKPHRILLKSIEDHLSTSCVELKY